MFRRIIDSTQRTSSLRLKLKAEIMKVKVVFDPAKKALAAIAAKQLKAAGFTVMSSGWETVTVMHDNNTKMAIVHPANVASFIATAAK